MDSGIKLHKVPGVVLESHAQTARLVDLHLTAHHTILVHGASKEEVWISHSLLLSIHLQPSSSDHHSRTPLVLRGRDFEGHTILFNKRSDAKAIYESLEAVIARRTSPDQLYAYSTLPQDIDQKAWHIYDTDAEFARMGVFGSASSSARTSAWRVTNVNASYDYCPTYPATLVVPSKISDTTLNYGKGYRSKARIPALVYLHWANLGCITRSSQPMVGLKNNRSIQDEKLIEAIFTSHSQHHSSSSQSDMAGASYIAHSQTVYGATSNNLIIDARPTTNAMANVAKGAGTENMEYYRNCKKAYLGIDNIHVMRDSLAKVSEATRNPDKPPNLELLRKSNWLKHLSAIMEGIVIIVKAVHLANSHVLVHCSDGWDRTSQLSSLSQLCLDPYYRTKKGLAVLIEKDWLSFGHRFADRCGHTVPARVQFLNTCPDSEDGNEEETGFLAAFQQRLNFSSSSHVRETCPVFDQFLDVIHQLQSQYPHAFEYNDQFLLDLQRLLYECNHGTFLYNSEKDRVAAEVSSKTTSIWQDLLAPAKESRYVNSLYQASAEEVIFPDPKKTQWWVSWLKRPDLNTVDLEAISSTSVPNPTIVEDKASDPVLSHLPNLQAENHNTEAHSSDSGLSVKMGNPRSTSPLPQSSASRPLPGVFDNPAVSSASTAVQGAMRSAWSAWKSVRTGYESSMREMAESGPPSAAPAANGALASRPANNDVSDASSSGNVWEDARRTENSRPAIPTTTPIDQNEMQSPVVKQAAAKSPEHSGSVPSKVAIAGGSRSHAVELNGSKSDLGVSDPLGVNVWS